LNFWFHIEFATEIEFAIEIEIEFAVEIEIEFAIEIKNHLN
jgi:hypothetical protein